MTLLARPQSAEADVPPTILRRVLGHYPTGVCIVTGLGTDDRPIGLTIGTFNSVSLEPPLVAFYAMQTSYTFAEIRAHNAFVVNVLGSREDYYCKAFSRPREERFTGIDWTPGSSGAPVLANAAAWIDCGIERVEEVGDHYWVLGRVRALDIGTGDQPLVFCNGGFSKAGNACDPKVRWHIDMTEQQL